MKFIYAVKDSATDNYGIPFFLNTRGEAMRHFTDAARANPEQSAIAKHPDDYTLHEIGIYDEKDGSITGAKPEQIMRAKDVILPKEPNHAHA